MSDFQDPLSVGTLTPDSDKMFRGLFFFNFFAAAFIAVMQLDGSSLLENAGITICIGILGSLFTTGGYYLQARLFTFWILLEPPSNIVLDLVSLFLGLLAFLVSLVCIPAVVIFVLATCLSVIGITLPMTLTVVAVYVGLSWVAVTAALSYSQ